MVISEYGAELVGGAIIAVAYGAVIIYKEATRNRLFNRVAEILAKP